MNQRIKALAVQATEIRQTSDHCSGQSETWSEMNLDTFTRILVEECAGVIKQNSAGLEQGLVSVEALKATLLSHFGLE
ncbi:MAG: hypothetical protein HYX45_15595 [Burkholderiales bacterium]|nr:hypothetical protein [Burkholderiales bacterium]